MHFTTMYNHNSNSLNNKCKGCRYYRFFDRDFGTGWSGCTRVWYRDPEDNGITTDLELSGIPDIVKKNCIAYEKRTLFSWLKPKKPLVDITEEIENIIKEEKIAATKVENMPEEKF